MRRLLLACCTCLACTRPNPAFDELLANEAGTDTLASTDTRAEATEAESEAEGEAEAETESEAEAESETTEGLDDLPSEPACAFQPSSGLALRFGDPEYFGACPTGVDTMVKVSRAGAGQAVVALCDPNCDGCVGEHPLTAYPMIITDYFPPNLDGCMKLQTGTLFGEEPSTCVWGALSLHNPVTGAPYVIATTHSSPPTPHGAQVLGNTIPVPEKAGSCNCDQVGQGNDCCYGADGPPEFWYYPFGGEKLYPGDFAPITLSNDFGIQHYFKVYQAERIFSCENQDLQLSWAVVAEP